MQAILVLLIVSIISLVILNLSHRTKKIGVSVTLKLAGFSGIGLLAFLAHLFNYIDLVSLVLGVCFATLSLLISLYTISYAASLGYGKSLESFMDMFLASITLTYIAPTLAIFAIAWTISEVLGYIVIRVGEEHSIEGSLTSSRGFILTSTLTYELSVFTLVSVSMIVVSTHVGLSLLITPFTSVKYPVTIPPFFLPLILLGFITKAANVPLHFWLPSAHSSAPSPGSAALSGLMVSLGYYGLYRVLEMVSINEYRELLAYLFLALGMLTVLYGGAQAINQRDVKRLLAYSTIATNGYVSLLFAMYALNPSELTNWTLVLGIVMHATYKATMFCEAGLIEAVYGTRYIHGIRGIVRVLGLSTVGGLLAVFSLLGTPGTLGFASKILSVITAVSLFEFNSVFALVTIAGLVVYMTLSALIALRYARIYFGTTKTRIFNDIISPPKTSQLPVLLLGVMNIALIVPFIPLIGLGTRIILAITVLFALASLHVVYSYFKAVSLGLTHEHHTG